MDPSIKCRFQPLSFSWVALHPKPKGIIQFVGGAFFGTFPTIAYRYFLCQLFNQGYTIVALPFKFSFRHWPISVSLFKEQLRLRQKLAAEAQSLGYEHEIYCDPAQYFWLGHSLGCKYIALLELLSDDLWQSVVESCAGEAELERIREAVTGLIDEKPSIKGQPSLLIAPDISDTESAIPIPFLARFFEQLGIKVLPTRMQTRCFIERSNLFNLTALISFVGDTIAGRKSDQDKDFKDVPWFSEQLQRRAFPLLHTELPGKHLEPLGIAVGRYIVDLNPLDKFFRLLPRGLEPVVLDYLEELARRAANPLPAGSVALQQLPAQVFPPRS